MDRYRYEPGTLDVTAIRRDIEHDDDVEIDETFEGFKIFDSQKGNTDDAWIAFSRDVVIARRIVDLLNADERAKQPEQGPASAAGR